MRFLKTMVLSTAHIKESDDNQLHSIVEHGNGDLTVIDNDYGWIIIMPEVLDDHNNDQNMSYAFWHLMHLAKNEGCDRLELDRDEEVDNTLPTFEW